MLQTFGNRLRKLWAVALRVCHVEGPDFHLLPLLLCGYLLLLQDFPCLHPDSLLQGAQKGCLMDLGDLVLLPLLGVLIPPQLLSLRKRTKGLWKIILVLLFV